MKMIKMISIVLTISLISATAINATADDSPFETPKPPSQREKQALHELLGDNEPVNNGRSISEMQGLPQHLYEAMMPVVSTDDSVFWAVETGTRSLDGTKGPGSRAVYAVENSVVEKVRNDTSPYSVRIEADRSDLAYAEGEHVHLAVKSTLSGYLYIVNQQADGELIVLFPNKYETKNAIQAGKVFAYPDEDSKYSFEVGSPFGRDVIMAIVSEKELDPKSLGADSFAKGRVTPLDDTLLAKGLRPVPSKKEKTDRGIAWACHSVTITTRPKMTKQEKRDPKRFLALFGANRYQSEQVRPLPACKNDVELMKAVFEQYGRINAVSTLVDKELTKANVRKRFAALAEATQPGDEIFLFWSGHGANMASIREGQPTGRTQYLLVYDSKLGKPETVITDDEFEHWLDDLDGRRIAIFFDACHAGGMIDGGPGTKSVDEPDRSFNFFSKKFALHKTAEAGASKDIRPDQAAVLCSSQADQVSVIDREKKYSAMTWLIAKRVSAGPKKVVFEDVCRFVEKEVPLVAEKQYNVLQKPVWINQIGEVFVKPE